MKSSLLYLFVVLFFFACNTSTQPIEKTWISKYRIYHAGKHNEHISSGGLKFLFRFDEDSLGFNDFQFMGASDKGEMKFKYRIHDTTLFLFDFNSEGIDTIPISLNDSQLVLQESPSLKTVFGILPTYNQAKEQQKLFNYLTSFTYKIVTDSFEVVYEFQKDYTTFNTTVHSNLFIKNMGYWKWTQSGTELFLELDDLYGNMLHIKTITEKEIKGVIYGKENREVSLERVLPQNKFNPVHLIGEWEEIIDYPLPPPPPPPPPGRKYYEKEILKISEKELIRHRFLGSDTVQWKMNRLNDKLFIPKYIDELGAWAIEKLDAEYLTIKRKWIYSSGLSFRWARKKIGQKDLIEQIKFRKVKK